MPRQAPRLRYWKFRGRTIYFRGCPSVAIGGQWKPYAFPGLWVRRRRDKDKPSSFPIRLLSHAHYVKHIALCDGCQSGRQSPSQPITRTPIIPTEKDTVSGLSANARIPRGVHHPTGFQYHVPSMRFMKT
jgi:hypothetical protein